MCYQTYRQTKPSKSKTLKDRKYQKEHAQSCWDEIYQANKKH